ncbi:TVP38/TMEM64 family protein [Paenibacillus turpanensis]|uniref:TVP38/TMEM64 family protein n=1 Tax=Paenibacillus turpanensis TaxID=2689078 RepID=UPI001408FA0D|nr:TVP38/TMEM64 family protein [Paenibacillus turpanensis]
MGKSQVWKKSLALLGLLAAGIGVVYFLFFTKTGSILLNSNVEQLSQYLLSFGWMAYVLAVAVVFTVTFFPVMPFFIIGGICTVSFGFVKGFIIAYTATVIAACISFYVTRYFAHEWVERRISRYPSIALFNQSLDQRGFFVILFLRVIPVIPSSVINFGAGISKIRFASFASASALGKLPIIFMECMLGYDLMHFQENKQRLLLLSAIFVVLGLVGVAVKKRMKAKNEVQKVEKRLETYVKGGETP